ncbi:MAG: 1-deoxy-D-xylulose-5-phosphate synthase [Spirochaetaceae bacterium]|nr:1-deoxy-D-xylulose-5-phosphate synthase [Spirochaetaceae bacterium]
MQRNLAELTLLCARLRQNIIETVAKNGGHLSSNLGVVELTVALHEVFSFPKDKVVWDVGHQCYAYKLLTGREDAFSTLRQEGGLSGFPRRLESEFDAFDTGHASTSISAALGLLAGERLLGGDAHCIAVIGDGALTGGLAYEALSNAAQLELPLIIILNDNTMSISPNVGGLSRHLSRLSMNRRYQSFRRNFDEALSKVPVAGEPLMRLVNRLKRAVKAVFYAENFFIELGFEYVGPVDGHNLRNLIGILRDVRGLRRPVVVHVLTQKGRGYKPAENDPGGFHSVSPFNINSGVLPTSGISWTREFGIAILEAGRKNSKVVAITAAMEKGTGLSRFRAEFPERFFDAGIAESHAVTFAAALAARGLRPVVAVYSTFLQRAVDQIIHDVALGKLPVVFAIDRAGFVGGDGATHQGLFDISILRSIPNISLLTPACGAELPLMLDWALGQDGPVAIRYPKSSPPDNLPESVLPLEAGRGLLLRSGENHWRNLNGRAAPNGNTGSKLCIAFTGGLFSETQGAAAILKTKRIAVDLFHLRFLKPIDETAFTELISCYEHFVIAEEGIVSGGIGEYAQALALKYKLKTSVTALGVNDTFLEQGTRQELIRRAGLDAESLAAIFNNLKPG